MKQFIFKDIRLKLLYILLLSITFISMTVIKDRFTNQTEIKRGVTYSDRYLTTNGEPLDLKNLIRISLTGLLFWLFIKVNLMLQFMIGQQH